MATEQNRLLMLLNPWRLNAGLLGGFIFWNIPLNWTYSGVDAIFMYLFLLAPVFVVYLGINGLLTELSDSVFFRLYSKWEGLAVLTCALSFLVPQGLMAGFVALPWVLVTLSLGFWGVHLFLTQGFEAPEELGFCFGLMFLPVGGVWLFMSRLGLNPMGFNDSIVLLTAIHFHFAGFATSFILGASGRYLKGHAIAFPLFLVALIGSLLGIPFLAVGISVSPFLEILSALIFVGSLLIWVGLSFFFVLPRLKSLASQVLLCVSATSILWSMFWALNFALAEYFETVWVSIPQMGMRHGVFNVLGFALPALLALSNWGPISRWPDKTMPWSQLRGKWRIGEDFFERMGFLGGDHPTGLIANFKSYQRPDVQLADLPPSIVDFYENTQNYELLVTPLWQKGFRLGGRVFRAVMDRVGQMALPIEAESTSDLIQSRILPLNDALDSRFGVRAWVRRYAETGKVTYAAAYSQHKDFSETYMNIAFPLPFSQMSSILTLDWMAEEKTLKLSSLPREDQFLGQQGVYFVLPWLGIRLPINETILVWEANQKTKPVFDFPEKSQLIAQHDMWFFGLPCLRLYYAIYPSNLMMERG